MQQSKGRILIVDDEVNARTALAEILRDEGYAVDTAADGFKALPKLEDFAPDAVLTDLRMPGMDGLELMRRVHERDADTPVVVVTAFAAVDRDDADPRRPAGHHGNEAFWARRGYRRQPGMTMRLHWNEVGVGDIEHPLTFWLRPLEAA